MGPWVFCRGRAFPTLSLGDGCAKGLSRICCRPISSPHHYDGQDDLPASPTSLIPQYSFTPHRSSRITHPASSIPHRRVLFHIPHELDCSTYPGSAEFVAPARRSMPGQFTCKYPDCPRSYNRKEHLVRHEKSHGEFRPFRCQSCGADFYRK